MIRKNQELIPMDMDTLGYFIYMDEMEKQQKQQQEDSDDSSDDESNRAAPHSRTNGPLA